MIIKIEINTKREENEPEDEYRNKLKKLKSLKVHNEINAFHDRLCFLASYDAHG